VVFQPDTLAMTDELEERFQQAIHTLGGTTGGCLLAVSGGKDSMVLMALANRLRGIFTGPLVVAHFDHGWRPESEQDAIFVMEQAAWAGFPCELGRPQTSLEEQTKTESIARQQRYDFLIRTAKEQNCQFVAAAHTADDQVETVLHHILRGTGLSGLAGMNPSRELVCDLLLIRPLLKVSRAEIDRYAQKHKIPFREDPTNASTDFTRNRIRHEVLPWLEQQGFEAVRDSLQRLSVQASEVQQSLEWVANEVLDRAVVEQSPEICVLNAEEMSFLPRHLLREVFVQLWRRQDWPRQEMGFADWDRLAGLVSEPTRFQVAGKIDCRQKRGRILLERNPGEA
jgi:tRNA(Ile)-lysidine synthase